MIEINLLPGAVRTRTRRATGLSLGSVAAQARSQVRDPYLLAAIASVVLAMGGVGAMYLSQQATREALGERAEVAARDSSRYALLLREARKAEATRDSVQRQLRVIKAIDGNRYVWPHILDEVSRALPAYTWLKGIKQLDEAPPPAASAAAKPQDPQPETGPLRFEILGNTVDIQALTRFMKLLESSPYVEKVQLVRSELVLVDGKEVTEFQLDAEYERPAAAGDAPSPPEQVKK